MSAASGHSVAHDVRSRKHLYVYILFDVDVGWDTVRGVCDARSSAREEVQVTELELFDASETGEEGLLSS